MSYNNFAMQQPFGAGHTGFTNVTPHADTSRDPLNWENPIEFGAERYEQAPTNEQNDETKAKQVGLAQRPFSKEDFQVKDGRDASITNSAFGARVRTYQRQGLSILRHCRVCCIWLRIPPLSG